jgi:hypothetical protein
MSGKQVGDVFVTNIIHRVVIEVNEEGILIALNTFILFRK